MFTLHYHNDRYVRLASLSLERCALCLLCKCVLPYITIVDWMKQYRDFIVATFNGLALVVVLSFFLFNFLFFRFGLFGQKPCAHTFCQTK